MSEQPPTKDAKYWCDLGWKQAKAGNHTDAIVSFEQALQRNIEFSNAWKGKGDALYSLQRYEEAINSYERAASLDPECERVWVKWGLALSQLQQHEEAIPYYDRALSIQPGSYKTLWAKGYSLCELNKFKEALKVFDKALDIKPDGHEVWALHGWALFALRQHKKAINSHEKALELQRDIDDLKGQEESLQALGGLYFFNGRMADFFLAFQQSREIANKLSSSADDSPVAFEFTSPNIEQIAQLNKLGWFGKLMGFAIKGGLRFSVFIIVVFAIGLYTTSILTIPIRLLWWLLKTCLKRF